MIKTSHQELLLLFEGLGIPRGGVVMLHTALFSLGLIEGGVAGFYRSLSDYVGKEGTIVVPTFTYSFRRNEVFDILNTPSAKNIGIFPEYIRNQDNAVRSSDPLFSMAAIGPRSRELMHRANNACFGHGSIYQNIFDVDAHFVGIGISYSAGMAGFMHLEKLAQVPYRVDIQFDGISRDVHGNEFADSAIHYARNEKVFGLVKTDREPMGRLMENKGASKVICYGHGKHLCIRGGLWRDIVLNKLSKSPFYMLDKS